MPVCFGEVLSKQEHTEERINNSSYRQCIEIHISVVFVFSQVRGINLKFSTLDFTFKSPLITLKEK